MTKTIHWAAAGTLALGITAATSITQPTPLRAESDLSGTWVVAQLTTTAATVPVVGTIYATTRMVTVHDLDQDGKRLRGPGKLCRLDIDSGSSMVSTNLSRRFKRSLPRPYIDAVIEKTDAGQRIRTGRRLVVVGAKLDEPAREPLPTRADDNRVFDQDGDGKPGVTINIGGIVNGDIYVAQRSWTRLLGTKRGDAFSGRVYFDNEQSILGATSSMLDDPPDAKPVPEKSWFRMERVPSGTSCRKARKLTAGWFE